MKNPVNISDIKALSELLNHGLDLAPDLVEHWLDSLPAESRHLSQLLRQLLTDHRAGAGTGYMDAPPQLNAPTREIAVRPGDTVGPYRLVGELGNGGMCTVWLAELGWAGSPCRFAIKFLRRPPTADLLRRMTIERDIAAMMDHPNVVRLCDAGNDDRFGPYLVLDAVQGVPLNVWCTSRQLGVSERLRVFLQLVRVVAYVHKQGVVHRDLKPANVLVSDDGQVHLLDFGIASRLDDSTQGQPDAALDRSLTPAYASPEQMLGATSACNSDTFSLGIMLFELLTGQLPFDRHPGLFALHEDAGSCSGAPRPCGVAKDESPSGRSRRIVDTILCKALNPNPRLRHATAQELADDISGALRPPPIWSGTERRRAAREQTGRLPWPEVRSPLMSFNCTLATQQSHASSPS